MVKTQTHTPPIPIIETIEAIPGKKKHYESIQRLWCYVNDLIPEQLNQREIDYIVHTFRELERIHSMFCFRKKFPYNYALRAILSLPATIQIMGKKAARMKRFICPLRCFKRKKLYNV